MQHFFTEPENINGNEIIIRGEDVNHIKNVLRMKAGEEISISNGVDDNEYRAEIVSIQDDEVACRLMFIKEAGVELPAEIVLFQGLPKSDKMDLIVQKAVELGASRIVPVATGRCVVKLDDKKAASKCERWQKIASSAAEQSKRSIIPEVSMPAAFSEAVAEAEKMSVAAIPYELAEGMGATAGFIARVKELAGNEVRPTVGIFIGPEGGFTEAEITLAEEKGITPISLGRRILRTETAGLTMLSILMYELEK
ncbi:MAG: 16S rRNA (uracil(1498)-N(3))-methyltransferase [Lachnospiraceae bacterium]|nr:16S rRNA (uracil(1498)-N(3))-methyltransferase [Lachnospiraceae bacterium]